MGRAPSFNRDNSFDYTEMHSFQERMTMDLVISMAYFILGLGDWPQLVVALAPGLRVHAFRQPPA